MAIPGEEIWAQFPVIGVIVAVVIVLAMGARKFWREFTGWLDTQDSKRETERAAQRTFERQQNELREAAQDKRDQAWRSTVQEMQQAQTAQAVDTNELLTKLVMQMNELGHAVHEHDEWARQTVKPVDQVEKITPRKRSVRNP